jgi:hypothetical protein
MQEQYWMNTEKERNQLQTVLNNLWKYHKNYNRQYLTIQPYVFNNTTNTR